MYQIAILTSKDVIKKGDWCRPLSLSTMSGGMSDYYSFKSEFSGSPENNTLWCRVERIMPFWIGASVSSYNEKMKEINKWEFIRGQIPESHIHEDAENPEYNQKLTGGVYDV
jgi:hypothetical protein